MTDNRLSNALNDALFSLPETGDILLIRPAAGYDISALPRDRLRIANGYQPDASYWQASGLPVADEPEGDASVAIVVLPRSKSFARHLIAEAVARVKGGLVIVDGHKTNGVDSIRNELRKRVADVGNYSKSHGRLLWFTAEGDFSDWVVAEPVAGPEGFLTQPGVFSELKIDKGSTLLAEALPAKLPSRMADFGAGWGYLSKAILAREGVESLEVIEAEQRALDCAKLNVIDPRAEFHWGDVRKWQSKALLGGIVCNPPFHTSREGDPGLGRAFIEAAAAVLSPKGQLWMVANRHLPYEETLDATFRQVTELKGNSGFKLFLAERPHRPGGSGTKKTVTRRR